VPPGEPVLRPPRCTPPASCCAPAPGSPSTGCAEAAPRWPAPSCPDRARRAMTARSSSDRNPRDSTTTGLMITSAYSRTENAAVGRLRPNRHRVPVRRLTPTVRHASVLLTPCAISLANHAGCSDSGSAPLSQPPHETPAVMVAAIRPVTVGTIRLTRPEPVSQTPAGHQPREPAGEGAGTDLASMPITARRSGGAPRPGYLATSRSSDGVPGRDGDQRHGALPLLSTCRRRKPHLRPLG